MKSNGHVRRLLRYYCNFISFYGILNCIYRTPQFANASNGGFTIEAFFDDEYRMASNHNRQIVGIVNITLNSELSAMPSVKFRLHKTSVDHNDNRQRKRRTTEITDEIFHLSSSAFRKLSADGKQNETMWFGSLLSSSTNPSGTTQSYRTGFCTIYASSKIIQSATISTEMATYDVVYLSDKQQHQIRSTNWADFPREEPPKGKRSNVKQSDFTGSKPTTNDDEEDNEDSQDDTIDDDDDNSVHSTSNVKDYEFVGANLEAQIKSDTDDTSYNNSLGDYILVAPEGWDDEDDGVIQYGPASLLTIPPKNTIFDRFATNSSMITKITPNLRQRRQLGTQQQQSKKKKQPTIIDVLVVVSNRAMCEYAGIWGRNCSVAPRTRAPMQARLKAAEAETNNALRSINVRIRIVRIAFTSNTKWDPIADQNSLDALANNKRIKKLRKQTGADLVSIVAGNSGWCGIAFKFNFKSIVSQDCLSQYSFSHEIGHNFGCNHNRAEEPNQRSPFAYGYIFQNTYRTFLSYNCNTKAGCPRLPYYSSSKLRLADGRPLGNPANDNLRQISSYAPTIAAWRTPPKQHA